MSETIQAIRGMNDVLPDQAPLWEFFEDTVRDWLRAYGYRNIRMPVVERTELFVRSIGEVTDIVEKEMYTFVDQLNGESLTLRPEGTASCVRAAIEHNLLYGGPAAALLHRPDVSARAPAEGALPAVPPGRRRSPGLSGAGRRRRAYRHGGTPVEAARAGRTSRSQINTLGSPESRARYRARLVQYLEQQSSMRWTKTPAGACTPIRCACWTARTRRCRR